MSPEKARTALALGGRIRSLRRRLNLTLSDVAIASGLSKPFLSQVERGHAAPSFTSLSGVARALGVTTEYFVDTPVMEAGVVHRGAALKFFGFGGSVNQFARLTESTTDRQLGGILVRMPPGQQRSEVSSHASEEFLYVIRGQIALTLDGKTFELRAGDTAHYESTTPRAWVNTAEEETVLVWVGTPGLF